MSVLTKCLRDLVSIPSPNPPGDTRQIAYYIAQRLRSKGCEVQVISPVQKEHAASVVATVGKDHSNSILFHAHIDTVPIAPNEHWTIDPFAGKIRDGRLYGKGSVDDKAALAAMMIVMERLASQTPRGRLTLVAAAEEEVGGQLGTHWLVEEKYIPQSEFVVVGEQTQNRVAIANKGVMRATVRTIGKSVHATNPDRGVNSIQAMAQVVLALGEYHRRLAECSHPLLGSPTCNVGIIQGGTATNVVPDACTIQVDRRLIPGETPEFVQDEMSKLLSALSLGGAAVEIENFLFSAPFEIAGTDPYTLAFMEAARSILGTSPGPVGYLPGSDAKHLINSARRGIVVFGPGSYEVSHASDEFVEVKELEETVQILEGFARTVLLKEKVSWAN